MLSLGLFVRLEAKPGKENGVAAFLTQGLQMANQEATTPLWFALRLGPSTFAVVDAFPDESGRQAHRNGPIPKALMAQAADLLAVPPSIEKTDVLGAKVAQHLKQKLDTLSLGLFVRLEAKPGKENEVAAFLGQALQMANQEATTPLWLTLRLGPSTFAVFDVFADESGRQAHLNGPIAQALMANAPSLFAVPPVIDKTEVVGAKISPEV